MRLFPCGNSIFSARLLRLLLLCQWVQSEQDVKQQLAALQQDLEQLKASRQRQLERAREQVSNNNANILESTV